MGQRGSLVVAIVCALGASARASAAEESRADALFRAGREAADVLDWDVACEKLRASQQESPAADAAFGLADCEEHRGRLATAWRSFREALTLLPPSDGRRADVEARIAAIEPRVPRIRVRLPPDVPADAAVEIDGAPLARATLATPERVDPGRREVRLRVPGRPTAERVVQALESTTLEVVFPPEPTKCSRTLGWIVGGAGVAALGVGAVTGVIVLQRKSEADRRCPDKRCADASDLDLVDSGRRLAPVSTVGLAVGAVGAAVGGYLVLSCRPGGAPATTIAPTAAADGAGLSLWRSF